MTIGEKIKLLREKRGMTQVELAQIVGVSDKAVSTWENGVNIPRMGVIQKIAACFNVSKAYLVEDEPAAAPTLPANLIPISELKMKRVPIIGKVAAGVPIIAEREYDECVEIPEDGRRYDVALRVQGDSMEPMYMDGDIVFIRQQDDVDDGQIAAVCLDDEVTLKHVYHIANGVHLVSENRKYPPMMFTNDDVENIHLVGLAVGFLRWVE